MQYLSRPYCSLLESLPCKLGINIDLFVVQTLYDCAFIALVSGRCFVQNWVALALK